MLPYTPKYTTYGKKGSLIGHLTSVSSCLTGQSLTHTYTVDQTFLKCSQRSITLRMTHSLEPVSNKVSDSSIEPQRCVCFGRAVSSLCGNVQNKLYRAVKCRALPWPLRNGDSFPCCHCVDILPISTCSIIIKGQTWCLSCIVFVLFCFLCHWWHPVEPFVGKLWRSVHWLVMVWIVLWPMCGISQPNEFKQGCVFYIYLRFDLNENSTLRRMQKSVRCLRSMGNIQNGATGTKRDREVSFFIFFAYK